MKTFISRKWRVPIRILGPALILLIAGLAATGMAVLKHWQRRAVREAATRAVIEQGGQMAHALASHPAVGAPEHEADWATFSDLIHSLHAVEEGLQYVSVKNEGVIVFHRQANSLDAGAPVPSPPDMGQVTLKRKRLRLGKENVSVVVFALPVAGRDGSAREIEVAIRKDTLGRQESPALDTVASMFRLSLLMITLAFLICAGVVVWLLHRESRREAMRRAQEHLTFSGVMANGIAHDFRNPMSSLHLDIQMLGRETKREQGMRPERIAELTTRVQKTLDRMDKVFKEFLYLSRPPSGHMERVDLAQMIRDCVEMLTPRLERATVTPHLVLPSREVPVVVFSSGLRRALTNVLINAEQFSPPQETLEVRLTMSRGRAILDVLDRGPGLTPRERQRVFDMFVTARPGGTGLGLFLARAAIHRSNGTIEARPREGKGACFRITLPLASDIALPKTITDEQSPNRRPDA